MVVAVKTKTVPVGTTATSISATIPSSVVVGDYLVAFHRTQFSGGTVDIPAPSGWTRIAAPFSTPGATYRISGLWAKAATSTDANSIVTFTNPEDSASNRRELQILVLSGVDLTAPIAATSGWRLVSGTSVAMPAFPLSSDLFTIEMMMAEFGAPNSYALTSTPASLVLEAKVLYNATAIETENTAVSRSAIYGWAGYAPSGGMPAHNISTTGTASGGVAQQVAFNASTSSGSGTPSGTSIAVRAVGGVGRVSTGSTVSAVVPGAAQVGDYLIALVRGQNPTNSADYTPPSGWTRIGATFVSPTSQTRITSMWAKFCVAGDPGSTVTWTNPETSVERRVVSILALSGVDPLHPVQGGSGYNINTGGNQPTHSVPAFSVAAGKFVLEQFGAEYSSGLSYAMTAASPLPLLLKATEVSGGTEDDPEALSFSRTAMYVFGGDSGDGSGIPAHGLTTSGAQAGGTSQLIALNAVVTSGTLPAPSPNRYPHSATLYSGPTIITPRIVESGGTVKTAQFLNYIPPLGYKSVAEMEAQDEFWIAHRGGSISFPEMSGYAYMESAMLGFPAVELSMARTSDGVYFGLHDSSLDRTSLNTGGGSGTSLVASTLTWAQVQTYSILGLTATDNPSQPNRPYQRFEDFLKAWPSNRVCFIDPKYVTGATNLNQILDMMDANGGPTKFVAKSFGITSMGAFDWIPLAQSRGYKTWGYFYDDATTTDINFYAPRYTYVGMNYTAANAKVTALMAASIPGAKLIAHIHPNAASILTARAWSIKPHGFMCSGTIPIAAAYSVKPD